VADSSENGNETSGRMKGGVGSLWTSWATISSSGKTLLHGIRYKLQILMTQVVWDGRIM